MPNAWGQEGLNADWLGFGMVKWLIMEALLSEVGVSLCHLFVKYLSNICRLVIFLSNVCQFVVECLSNFCISFVTKSTPCWGFNKFCFI